MADSDLTTDAVTELIAAELDEHGYEDDDEKRWQVARHFAAVLRERYDITEKGQLRQEWGVQDGADSPPYFSHPTREGAENHRQTILGNYVGAPKKPLKPPPNPSIVSRLVSSWRVVDGQETASTPVFDEDGRFQGHQPRSCGEHRTVGTHRAWCHDCGEWCYPRPEMACIRCQHPAVDGQETHP